MTKSHPLSSLVCDRAGLIDLAAMLTADRHRVDQLCPALGLDADGVAGSARSSLNDDGEPVQLCATATATTTRYRLIVDPHADRITPGERMEAGFQALRRLPTLTDTTALVPLIEAAARRWLPQDDTTLAALTRGVFWLAAGLDTPGVALYAEGRVGGVSAAWRRAHDWLRDTVPSAEPAWRFVDALAPHAQLGSVGIEGTSPNDARVKLYWRLRHEVPLATLGLPLIATPPFTRFLTIMAQRERPFSTAGLVWSAGFSMATGELVDVKLDVCTCSACLALDGAAFADRLATLCAAFALSAPPLAEPLMTNVAEGVFLGLGVDVLGRHRLNAYLKPAACETTRAA